jgi:excisionase family DNA binding protein
MNEFMNGQLSNSPVSHFNTMNIDQASRFLGAHKETIRRLAAEGILPAVKIGRGWCFIEQDLVLYMRSQYSARVTSQGATKRSKQQWRFTKETKLGGLASHTRDKEYNEALGLRTK